MGWYRPMFVEETSEEPHLGHRSPSGHRNVRTVRKPLGSSIKA